MHIISISSGKGGVGKTVSTIHIAIAAAKLGRKVLVLDGDVGLANLDILLGLNSRYNIDNVLNDKVSLEEVIIKTQYGIDIIPTGSGISRLAQMSYLEQLKMMDSIDSLQKDYDTMFIDTGAGIGRIVCHFMNQAHDSIVVTTPEPHAVTDAYALLKVFSESKNNSNNRIHMLCNRVRGELNSDTTIEKINTVAKNYLNLEINNLGSIPEDPLVNKAINSRSQKIKFSLESFAGYQYLNSTKSLFEYEPLKSINSTQAWTNLFRNSIPAQAVSM